MRSATLGLLLALFLATPAAAQEPDAAALSPAPRDAEGRFLNTIGAISHADASVRLPFFLRRMAGQLRTRPGAPSSLPNDGAFLRENALHSKPTVTWVGHATLLVQMDHVTFLTDPIWSDTPSPIDFGPRRFVDPGVALDALPPIDFVLISHNHYDHLDLPTLTALAARDPATRFFVPLGNAALLREEGIENIEELDWGMSRTYEGVQVVCTPSQHWSRRALDDERATLWSSWVVTGPTRRFYFAGDTGYFAGFTDIARALGPFHLAALPIGAYEPKAMMKDSHLNPEEAVQAALDLDARTALGMHYGTFDLSDEPLDEPPRRFRAAGAQSALGESGTWILAIGETREF
jgi:N-acyl-phosphatidylethanolamine-hydrolysing phospholipase D